MERENLAGDAKGKGASGSNREARSTEAPEALWHLPQDAGRFGVSCEAPQTLSAQPIRPMGELKGAATILGCLFLALSGLFARSVPISAFGGEPDYRQSTPRGLRMTQTGHGRSNFALMSLVKRGRRGWASSRTICVGSYRGYDRATVGVKP